MTPKNFPIIKLIFLIFILIFSDTAVMADEELTMGVFPRRNSTVTIKMFRPFANFIAKETGIKIRLETAKNFSTFWKNVKAGRYDIAHFNQLHYLLSKDTVGYQVFAKNEEFGKSKVSPAIVVRKDSGIKSLNDLKGKTIIFGGGKLAMIAHVGNKVILYDAGIQPDTYKSIMAKNPPNATLAVYYKRADAAGIGDVGLSTPAIKKKMNTDEMFFLATGVPQPHLPWVFKKSLKLETKNKIRSAITKLNSTVAGKNILNKAAMTALLPATDAEYKISQTEYDRFKKYNRSQK